MTSWMWHCVVRWVILDLMFWKKHGILPMENEWILRLRNSCQWRHYDPWKCQEWFYQWHGVTSWNTRIFKQQRGWYTLTMLQYSTYLIFMVPCITILNLIKTSWCIHPVFYYTLIRSTCFGCNLHPSSGASICTYRWYKKVHCNVRI